MPFTQIVGGEGNLNGIANPPKPIYNNQGQQQQQQNAFVSSSQVSQNYQFRQTGQTGQPAPLYVQQQQSTGRSNSERQVVVNNPNQ